jgi:hypothetical protein
METTMARRSEGGGMAWAARSAAGAALALLVACTGRSNGPVQGAAGDGSGTGDPKARPDEEGIDPWGEPGGTQTTDVDAHTVPIGGPTTGETRTSPLPQLKADRCAVTEQRDGRASVALTFVSSGAASTTLTIGFTLDALPAAGKTARTGTREGDLAIKLAVADKQSPIYGTWAADRDASGAIKPDCALVVREAQQRDAAGGGREQRLGAQVGCQNLPGREPSSLAQSYLSFTTELYCRGPLAKAP